MQTKPEVFIIESVDFDNEDNKQYEGHILSEILALSDKQCKYYYIRTKRELIHVLGLFTSSTYRYLHLSCHANESCVATTLDRLSFAEFATLIRPHLNNRRLFLSACSMANMELAKLLIPDSGCYSILGPAAEIRFNDAAILWAALYHVMFAHDANLMKPAVLRSKAQAVADLFKVQLNYFRRGLVSEPVSFHQIIPNA
jgi:hypothetical protein